ncbi:DUF982 domain-containing protein [Mesorhizobium carmichaelinearum]|uniref:DUF982 domain-containing protein n=1 Tax=Mesorhizobium carmichaelinearum TaxID=1208188 RepID=UPI000BA390D5|nr:DUF982 domain-containing protein [Mesorhizobium carmichaelinearum]
MTKLQFFVPVKVTVEDTIREINTVRDAIEFLRRWPKGRRGPVFSCAERSCNAAIAGQMTVDQARQSFVSFARIAGLLEDSRQPQPWLAGATHTRRREAEK